MNKILENKRWNVLGAAFCINIIIGILYSWSIISKALITDLNWTGKEASLPYTAAIVAFVISMVFFGRVQDIKGPRLTAAIAGILIGIGLILSAYFMTPVLLVIAFGIITGSGIGIASVSTTPPTIKWFPPDKKGMITGLTVAGVGISAAFYSPLTNSLIQRVGVPKTFLYLGIGALVLMVILAQILTNPPEGYIASNNGAKNSSGLSEPVTFAEDADWRKMLKSLSFYKLWIMFAFSASAGLMIIGHAANIAKFQVHWEGGFYLVVLLSIFNATGRFFGGTVSDKIGRINLMRIVFLFQAFNMLLFSRYTSIGLLCAGIAVTGLCYGATFSVFPAATIDLFGIKNFGANYGLIMTGWGFGGVIGPMTAAAFFDFSGDYSMAYIVSCALLIITLVITLTFRKSFK